MRILSGLILFGLGLSGLFSCQEVKTQQVYVNQYGVNVQMGDPKDANYALRRASRAIVRIVSGAGTAGTGFFVENGQYLLTNEHVLGSENCLTDGCYVSLDFHYERGSSHRSDEYFMLPVFADRNMDFAIYEVYNQRNGRRFYAPYFLEASSKTAADLVGSRVHVIGHPLGLLKKWVTGEVLETVPWGGPDWLSATNLVFGGNSGSPILDEQGRYVGQVHRASLGKEDASHSGINSIVIGTASRSLLAALQQVEQSPRRSIDVAGFYSSRDFDLLNLDLIRVGKLTQYQEQIEQIAFEKLDACIEGLALVGSDLLSLIGDSNRLFDQGAGERCAEAMRYVGCQAQYSTVNKSLHVCPALFPSYRSAWYQAIDLLDGLEENLGRMPSLYFAMTAMFHGSLSFSMHREILEQIESNTELVPRLNPSIAYLYLDYQFDYFRGWDLRQYLKQYRQIPNYQYYVEDIALGNYLWARPGNLDVVDELMLDPKVSLRDKLMLEDAIFEIRN